MRAFALFVFCLIFLIGCDSFKEEDDQEESLSGSWGSDIEKKLSKNFYESNFSVFEDTLVVDMKLPRGEMYYQKKLDMISQLVLYDIGEKIKNFDAIKIKYEAKNHKKYKESYMFTSKAFSDVLNFTEKKLKFQRFLVDSLNYKVISEMDEMLRQIYTKYNPDRKPPKFIEVIDGFLLRVFRGKERE